MMEYTMRIRKLVHIGLLNWVLLQELTIAIRALNMRWNEQVLSQWVTHFRNNFKTSKPKHIKNHRFLGVLRNCVSENYKNEIYFYKFMPKEEDIEHQPCPL